MMKLDSPTRNTEAWLTVASGPPRCPRYSKPRKSPKNASLSARFFTGSDQWVSRSAPSTSHLVSAEPPPRHPERIEPRLLRRRIFADSTPGLDTSSIAVEQVLSGNNTNRTNEDQ